MGYVVNKKDVSKKSTGNEIHMHLLWSMYNNKEALNFSSKGKRPKNNRTLAERWELESQSSEL